MRFKGVIFDMDGVLFDTERIFQETWAELAAERNILLPKEFVNDISGTNGAQQRKVVEMYYNVADGGEIAAQCHKRVSEKVKMQIPLKEGVLELLEYLRTQKIPVAIASSSPKAQIEANIKTADIASYFDAVVSASEVENGKPAPDIFWKAAEKIGRDPSECCVFEDSMHGIEASSRAGCITVMIPDLIPPTEAAKASCHRIYDSLSLALANIEDL